MLILSLFLSQSIYVVIGFIIAIPIAITVHEFAHAWEANRLGDPTAKHMGRLSLNPLKHLDVFGTIMIFLVGFGWGKPTPYDSRYLRHGKKDEVKIAIAGPISNLICAFIFALPYRIQIYLHADWTSNPFFQIVFSIMFINISLAVFNLLPIPPLDGSKIIYLFVSDKTKSALERYGPLALIALIFAVYILRLNIFSIILLPIIQWLQHFLITFP